MRRLVALGALALAACGELKGFDGPAPPLVSFQVAFYGDLPPLRPPGVTEERELRLALVWGAPWLTEPFCALPPRPPRSGPSGEDPRGGDGEVDAVIAAGCRDPFGFAPAAVTASVPLRPYGDTLLSLAALPAAEVMVGDVTGRVAYGSLVVFDDRDGTGALELARPHGTAPDPEPLEEPELFDSPDIIYAASFVTMTEGDTRVAYREGRFDFSSAFYPRSGCLPPEPGFSLVGAGGFSPAAGLEAIRTGTLPAEDPGSCFGSPAGAFTVGLGARPPAELQEVGCLPPRTRAAATYNEPPSSAPDLTDRVTACVPLPSLNTGGTASSLVQLVVSGRSTDRCKGLTHYVLRGCTHDVACAQPTWDRTASPPSWWPCPQ